MYLELQVNIWEVKAWLEKNLNKNNPILEKFDFATFCKKNTACF